MCEHCTGVSCERLKFTPLNLAVKGGGYAIINAMPAQAFSMIHNKCIYYTVKLYSLFNLKKCTAFAACDYCIY